MFKLMLCIFAAMVAVSFAAPEAKSKTLYLGVYELGYPAYYGYSSPKTLKGVKLGLLRFTTYSEKNSSYPLELPNNSSKHLTKSIMTNL
ncbi:hypothetical protein RN001_005021 [Aquatica leii]|uniref:Uncharacterized protein n=1 Tax=Aquatica leii TaxID=1421715 RepID=A0AAN7SHQ4_9COLE|nr:hypothetical protein RN001_005021 [Aquatica leii]